MSRPKLKKTGKFAFVEMGEWDGTNYELEGSFPVFQLSDGNYVVMLGPEELPEETRSTDIQKIRRNRS